MTSMPGECDRYLTHARRFGISEELLDAAKAELTGDGLEALVADLRAGSRKAGDTTSLRLVEGWSKARLATPDGRENGSSDERRPMGRVCSECGHQPVAYGSRTGVCRRCQYRLSKRRRRAAS
jgi:hypothetical protein